MVNPNYIRNEIILIRCQLNSYMRDHEAGRTDNIIADTYFKSIRNSLIELLDEDFQRRIGSYPSSLQNRQILSMIDSCRFKIESIKRG